VKTIKEHKTRIAELELANMALEKMLIDRNSKIAVLDASLNSAQQDNHEKDGHIGKLQVEVMHYQDYIKDHEQENINTALKTITDYIRKRLTSIFKR
jgi:chromosome segregation ATPase